MGGHGQPARLRLRPHEARRGSGGRPGRSRVRPKPRENGAVWTDGRPVMEDVDLRVDGNAVGGLLSELFVYEMTSARSTCANCGAVGEVGTLLVYVHAPGTVIRCPRC